VSSGASLSGLWRLLVVVAAALSSCARRLVPLVPQRKGASMLLTMFDTIAFGAI
jgi:hypothetical protein